ncbi:MAG: flagellin, partial [Lachnospiraceae bacterium]|nr:flagellin [Lachnospiraceae bacterium]
MSVQTNILAWNAGRQFKINTKKQAKSTEKLSSGYRINRAADDAAGLSISEKMRRQIRGLKQGSDNVEEGI